LEDVLIDVIGLFANVDHLHSEAFRLAISELFSSRLPRYLRYLPRYVQYLGTYVHISEIRTHLMIEA
jgi:hypothetical protein